MSHSAKDLIIQAFQMAREAGKPDWARMTIPVLKNRLLHLTDRQFSPETYGARNMFELVANNSDVVELDNSRRIPAAVLKPDVVIGPASAPAPTEPRVRPDLWNAVLDYSSGEPYVWDQETGRARKAELFDADKRPLPTVTREELQNWREAFAADNSAETNPREGERLAQWRDEGLSTGALPPRLRGPWNAALKARVGARLREWFTAAELPVPPDMLVRGEVSATPVPTTTSDVEAARALVMQCVSAMTPRELFNLNLPVSVLFRLKGGR